MGFKARKKDELGVVDLSALPAHLGQALVAVTAHEAQKLAMGGAYIKGLRFAVKADQVVSTIEAQMPELEFIQLTFNLNTEVAVEE